MSLASSCRLRYSFSNTKCACVNQQIGMKIELVQWDASVAMLSWSSCSSTASTPLKVSRETSILPESLSGALTCAGTVPGSSSIATASPGINPFLDHPMDFPQSKGRAGDIQPVPEVGRPGE